MNDKEIENEIIDRGLTAPRVTLAQVNGVIKHTDYHVFKDSCLTVCCLTLRNGFTVTGESACASPENFDAELGKKIARDNAKKKIWMLEGYLLKERLHQDAQTTEAETIQEGGLPKWHSHKVVKAAQIVAINGFSDEFCSLVFNYPILPITVSQEYMKKHDPQIGGYYVLYEDGYQSWSPAVAFEDGYTKIS